MPNLLEVKTHRVAVGQNSIPYFKRNTCNVGIIWWNKVNICKEFKYNVKECTTTFHIFPLKIWAKKVNFFIPVIFLFVNGTHFGIYGCLRLRILPNFDLNTVWIKNWPHFPINWTHQLKVFYLCQFLQV